MRRTHVTRFLLSSSTLVVALLALGVMMSGLSIAQEAEETPELVGAKKCGMCHKKEASGAQLVKWEESRHAKAFATLASEKAVAKAKELGLGNPQESAVCLRCHVTAFPVLDDIANQKITLEEGVSCESCHGAGGDYWKKKTMTAVFAGEVEAASVGLQSPVTEETCVGCHNEENPFHKEFNFAEASAKIAHKYPDGYRTAAK